MLEVNDFNAIRISLASPDQIRSWSYGEVTKPETINYRTLKPEKDGLFCERIFGPTKDWECYCGKYKRVRFKGIVCDKCGVEVARSKVRRERMGHIELASPVSHIWYFKGTPSRIGLLLDLSPRNLERILYFALYVVTKVDDEARQMALSNIEEGVAQRIQQREEEVTAQIVAAQERRDEQIAAIERKLEEQREQNELNRSEQLQQARDLEKTLRATLRENLGKVLMEDIIYEPTGERVAQQGVVVDATHLEALERIAQEHRDLVVEAARKEMERARADAERETERARMNAEGEIATIQDQLVALSNDVRAETEARRRDLEGLKKLDLLQEQRYRELKDFEYQLRDTNPDLPEIFEAGMGAESVQSLLADIDLDELAAKLRSEIESTTGQRRKKATKRLNVVEAFRKSGNRPEWMILSVLPVLPPDLRPMVQLDGGRFATSDLNDLYRRVINRNNRLKRLLELGAPEIIIRNEKRMLQEACDALIDNGRRGRAVAGSGNHKLKSLSDMLKGKQGRFRQNLLGKRVDYSGRSVIVVGPELKLHQCGLPKRMALELFKPFVMRKLVERNFAHNIRSAKRVIERVRPEVWDVLEEVIKDHPVLLNRAPTLHRLGIQSFEAVLVEGSAIQIHPLVCHAFNADFDGDQMAVHVPLSRAAQLEAKTLLLSSRNLLSPANGEPTVAPTKDMVLGCYYLTCHIAGEPGDETAVFGDFSEAVRAYDAGRIGLHAHIYVMIPSRDLQRAEHADGGEWVQTSIGRFRRSDVVSLPNSRAQGVKVTVGRIIFNEVLPPSLPFKNETLDKGKLRDVVGEVYRVFGPAKTATVADEIKRLGFTYATKSGTTMAISDVTIPEAKELILTETQREIDELDRQFRRGLITQQERYEARIRRWTEAKDKVTKAVTEALDKNGPIYVMAVSGAAKGHFTQVSQIAGMRGLMADPSGQIIDLPIKSNFREGLTMLEYFISTHGARKGLADTALRTAESGYLTRRLIDVGQDVIVYDEDCTPDPQHDLPGILIPAEEVMRAKADEFRNRITGRWLAEAFVDHQTGEVIA